MPYVIGALVGVVLWSWLGMLLVGNLGGHLDFVGALPIGIWVVNLWLAITLNGRGRRR